MKFIGLVDKDYVSPVHKRVARLKKYRLYYKIKARIIVKYKRIKRYLKKLLHQP